MARMLALIVVIGWSAMARSDPALVIEPAAPPPIADPRAAKAPADPTQQAVYICPMDPDVRSDRAGKCRRCGMALITGVAEPAEFHLDVTSLPQSPEPGRPAVLQYAVHDPWKNRPVGSFNLVHEKLFHTFVVSQDLEFFVHGHPSLIADGLFQFPLTFPKPGVYRVLGDFYPVGSLPQLSSETVIVPGEPPAPVTLGRDYSPKDGANLHVSLETIPDQPTATNRAQLRFVVKGEHPLEKYLGAWGHMLVASNDLIDMMHEHPFLADGGPRVEYEVVFPRAGAYRVWVQFQSAGVVNTVRFDIPVAAGPPTDEPPAP
jgi:hypothetical protein